MIKFPCGCEFETNEHGRPIFNPHIDSIPLDCSRTWDMICEGNTKGVFQLESQLGQGKAKQIKPRSIEELSDLIAVIRPGVLDSMLDGKSLTQHYIDRKSGKDQVKFFHPVLEPILKNTYGILVYQEQAMKIAQQIAGFNLQQADNLRKAIGKKKVDLMAQVKSEFLEGCIKTGVVSEKDAKEIFDWIEKSQKYSFNKSHSVSYACNGYQTAYCKAHFPRAFFTSYIRHAKGKIKPHEEINDLVNNAKVMNIEIQTPSVKNLNKTCELINNKPSFGLTEIKSVGGSVYEALKNQIKIRGYEVGEMGWGEFMMRLGRYIKKNSFENLISAGACDCFGVSRSRMLYEFGFYKDLRDTHKKFLEADESLTFLDGLDNLLFHLHNNTRQTVHTTRYIAEITDMVNAISNPPYKLFDNPMWMAEKEHELLGVEITCHVVDAYDTLNANCTCREFLNGFDRKNIMIAAKIEDIREWKIRGGNSQGQKMAFLKISDSSCSLDSVTIFTDLYAEHKNNLLIGNVMLFIGEKDKKFESFKINNIKPLNPIIY